MTPDTYRAEEGRLDSVVARLTGASRADVQRAIDAGRVLVDGKVRPRSFRLKGGEAIEIDLQTGQAPEAEEGEVPVRYRDEHLLVVAKPAGLVTHPTKSRLAGTLVNRLLGMGVTLAPTGDPLRPGIVHRLDAGTSGLMIVAETEEAASALKIMLKEHRVERRYLALVRGRVSEEGFGVEAPLARRAARIAVDRVEGRPAMTRFTVVERLAGATLLEAAPETGRTHQIRVHLAAIGHPILGDRRYGGGGDDARALGLTRPFLHSWKLDFEHPITGERVRLKEPLPPDLEDALEAARTG